MAEVSARHLLGKKVKRLLVANRTLEKARALAEKFNAQALSMEEGLRQVVSADIVIASAASSKPILSFELIKETIARRQNRSLFLVDIAVPRNIDPSVHQMDNVYLYNIDDLQAIVRENLKSRSGEIEKAARIVDQKSREFFGWVLSLKAGDEKSLKHSLSQRV
jgi:glutamyl-tRNA reductase